MMKDLPSAFHNVIYCEIGIILVSLHTNRFSVTTYAVCEISIIVSGLKYAAIVALFLILTIYLIQLFYLRTSRQLQHLNTEAKTPLYTLAVEISSGLEHIRAFGWQSDFIDEALRALDSSQKPYYYTFAIERWLELAIDCSSLWLAIVLISITTICKESTSQTAMGLSLLNLTTFGYMLNRAVMAWTTLETALGAVLRLRDFISRMPAEARGDEVQLPSRWPQSGNIVFSNVTAKYRYVDMAVIAVFAPVFLSMRSPGDTTAALYNVSLNIDDEQKVGISGRTGRYVYPIAGAETRVLMLYFNTVGKRVSF